MATLPTVDNDKVFFSSTDFVNEMIYGSSELLKCNDKQDHLTAFSNSAYSSFSRAYNISEEYTEEVSVLSSIKDIDNMCY